MARELNKGNTKLKKSMFYTHVHINCYNEITNAIFGFYNLAVYEHAYKHTEIKHW